jgi:serine phosphatase RsbU (regulator of sigma subunit)/CHASE3 domain sensor protein
MTIVFSIFLAVGIVLGILFVDVEQKGQDVTTILQPAATESSQLLVSNADMERGVLGYLIAADPAFLSPYVAGRAQGDDAIASLQQLLTGPEAGLAPLLQLADASRDHWMTVIAEPAIADVSAGRQAQAQEAFTDGTSRRASTLLRTEVLVLQDQIDNRLQQEYADLSAFTERLAFGLLAALILSLALMVGATVSLLSWVLRPIEELRAQMEKVAGDDGQDEELVPSGPPEIRAMGRDTERLRRRLVDKMAAARAANEALAQDSPTVDAIRRELTAVTTPKVPGYAVWGDLWPYEGLVVGDWWSTVPVGGGRTAIVVTDISGHDPAAGIAGLRLKDRLRAQLEAGVPPAQAVASCARGLSTDPSRFATCTVALLGAEGGLEWVNAGQHPPLLLTLDGLVTRLQPTGPIVSVVGGSWTAGETTMGIGDLLVCYTDGLLESRDGNGDELEESTLIEWCRGLAREGRGDTPDERVERVARGLFGLADRRSPDLRRDDVTIVVATRRATE